MKVKNSNNNNFSVPVINLSSHLLTEKEHNHLKYGLKYSFIHRNKDVKKYLSAELELCGVEPDKLEEYHELLRAYADVFSSNIYNSKNHRQRYKVGQGDKDSSIIIMDSKKYHESLKPW